MNRIQRGLLYAALVSAGLHLAVLAARPGSGARLAQQPAPAVLSTRLIEAGLSPTSSPAVPPSPATTFDTLASAPLTVDSSLVAGATSTPMPVPVPVPAPSPADATREAPPMVPPGAIVAAAASSATARLRPVEPPSAVPAPAAGPAELKGSAGDRGPQLLDDIDTTLPANAGGRGGSVTVRLLISEQGAIERVTILRSSPPGLLDEAALAALARARFAPGLRGGQPVRSEVVYEIDFAAIAKGADASGRSY